MKYLFYVSVVLLQFTGIYSKPTHAAEFQTTGSEAVDAEIKKSIIQTNAECGSDLSFIGDTEVWKRSDRSSQHCEVPFSGLYNWCWNKYDEVGKKERIKAFIKSNIKTIKCSFINKPNSRSLKLSGGTLTYIADSDMAENDGYVVNYLETQLPSDDAPVKSVPKTKTMKKKK